MKTLSLISLLTSILASQTALAGALPEAFTCYGQNGQKNFEFKKVAKKSYQLIEANTGSSDEPFILKYESHRYGARLSRTTRGIGGREVAEFGLTFISDEVIDVQGEKMAVIDGLEQMDIAFKCALPMTTFRALGGKFEIADGDDSANHQACTLYTQNLKTNDGFDVKMRDQLVQLGYRLVDQQRDAEFIFFVGEYQYCYEGSGPPWWIHQKGYGANLNSASPKKEIWRTDVDSVVLFRRDLATPRFWQKFRRFPSCENARKLISPKPAS